MCNMKCIDCTLHDHTWQFICVLGKRKYLCLLELKLGVFMTKMGYPYKLL